MPGPSTRQCAISVSVDGAVSRVGAIRRPGRSLNGRNEWGVVESETPRVGVSRANAQKFKQHTKTRFLGKITFDCVQLLQFLRLMHRAQVIPHALSESEFEWDCAPIVATDLASGGGASRVFTFVWVAGLNWGMHRKGLDLFLSLAVRTCVMYGCCESLMLASVEGIACCILCETQIVDLQRRHIVLGIPGRFNC